MNAFRITLRLLAALILVVCAMHLVLGLGADALLDIDLPPSVLADPSLNSQNRFFGVSFALYAAVLWLASFDLQRYAPLLKAALFIFLLGGLARLATVLTHGLPTPPVIGLMVVEIIAPIWLLLWLRRARLESPGSQ